ncbi:MAG: radical SAM protein [Anaerolineales bacterium]|nr:MAG: radical SAM protein [Anaerolineales bacterium]
MKLSGLHLLVTYQCNFECDHCFAWGSPWQSGTMTLQNIQSILRQAKDSGTVEWIYFEGGEPFLYYAALLKGVREAARMGFQVGVVSNSYWATDEDDALECLRPFAGLVQDLSISSDLYHFSQKLSQQAKNARRAAEQLAIPIGIISIAEVEAQDAKSVIGQLPVDESGVMYRGRATEKLAVNAKRWPWEEFAECPYEELREPERLHVDPYGNLHVCQGISIGNLFHRPLSEICQTYDPESHPVVGSLLAGGPAELIRYYGLPYAKGYADACHVCYEARRMLRGRFPHTLTPDQMYGVLEG